VWLSYTKRYLHVEEKKGTEINGGRGSRTGGGKARRPEKVTVCVDRTVAVLGSGIA